MSEEEFSSRSEAIDFGKDYEYLMAAYYSLKLSFDDEIKDFKISTNNDDMGDFDDVVIELTLASGEEHVFVIQLKHINRPIAQFTLINNNKKFGLKKYSKEFQKVKANYAKTRSYTASFENFHFVLFTNSNFEKSEEIEDHWKKFEPLDGGGKKVDSGLLIRRNQKHFSKKLINVSNTDENSTYEISPEVEGSPDDEFFKQFSFYTKQKSAKEMESLIAEIILKKFKGCDPNTVVNYLNYFNYWCRRDFGIFKLTKKDVRLKIAELVLTPYIPEPDRSKNGYFSETNEKLLYSLFSFFDVVLIDNQTEEMVNRIWSVVLQELRVYDLPWSLPVPTANITSITFFSDMLQIPFPPSAFCEKFSDFSLKKIYIFFWHKENLPLVVKIDKNSSHPQDVLLAIDLCRNKEKTHRIILIDENHHFKSRPEWIVFERLSDISCFKLLYDFVIIPTVNLQPLIADNEHFIQSITSTEFISMLDESFIIGKKCTQDVPKYYIKRRIPKVLLDANIVNESEKDLFVISGSPEMKDKVFSVNSVDLEKYLLLNQFGSNIDYFRKAGRFFVSATNGCSKEQFQEICSMNLGRNCHHVRFLDKDRIEWIESTDVRGIRKYFLGVNTFKSEDFVNDQDIFNYFTNKINIICADPGMGKSVMMKYLMLTCPSDYWCIMISLGEHAKFFKQERGLEEILAYFFKQECQTAFEEKVIKALSSRKQILFLWDGFDELPKESKSSVTLAIRILNQQAYPQWVAARNSSRKFLENSLKTIALTVTEFDHQDQSDYVYNHLMEKYEDDFKVQQIIDEVNKNITTSLTSGYFDYTGVPLQIHMVVEIYLRQTNKLGSSLITLTDIYQEFIRGKFDNFFEKADADTDNYFMQDICEEYSSAQLILYENAAMKTAFNDESLDLQYEDLLEELEEGADNLGLIVGVNSDQRVIFAHKTYEEFLSASWLAKHCHSNPEYVKALFREEYSNIRFMFDMLLAKDSPLHLAVLYKNIEMIKTHEDELETCKDKGGRSVMHLACSSGRHHSIIKVIQKDEEATIKRGTDAKEIYSKFQNDPKFLSIKNFDHVTALETLENMIKNPPSEDVPSPDNVIMINGDSLERRNRDDKTYLEILELLLDHRCDVFEPDELLQWNAFQYADHSFSLGVLNFMLKYHDINIHSLVNFNHIPTLLHYSVCGFYDNLFRIIPEVPYVEYKDFLGRRNLLQLATELDNLKAVTELLKHKVYLKVVDNSQTVFSKNPLMSCAINGNLEMMDILLENGASVNGHRNPPLYGAALGNKLSSCQKLLLAGADVNELTFDGSSTLIASMGMNNYELMKLLLEHGADVNHVFEAISPLVSAIIGGSLETVQLLLNYKPDLNHQCRKNGYTALHYASAKGSLEMVKCLIQHGADPKIKSKYLLTPLHTSLADKREEIALELIDVEPSVINEKALFENGGNVSPMMLATVANFPRVIEKLAQNGVDVNKSDEQTSPLRVAVELNFDSCAKVLIEAGASVNQENQKGFVPLFCAAKHLTTTKLLLDNGATLTDRDSTGDSVLHFAARGGNLEVAEELVKRGADMNAKNNQNHTPLWMAIQCKRLEMAKFFLDKTEFLEDGPELLCLAVKVDFPEVIPFLVNKGVDVNSCDAGGFTPLIHAPLFSNNSISVLLKSGADPNLSSLNVPPLLFSLMWGNTEACDQLIKSGADPQGKLGVSSLHLAAVTGDIFSMVLLIGNGADVNMVDENGQTPLHLLCNHITSLSNLKKISEEANISLGDNQSKEDCARELIAKGANINQKDLKGMTPLHVACQNRDENMIKLLIQKGADVNALNKLENSPLHEYFSKPFSEIRSDPSQNSEVVRLLISSGANLDQKNEEGWTPLHCACFFGDLDGVLSLIESGADPNAGAVITPLHAAAMNGHLEIVHLLLNLNADLSKRSTCGNTAIFIAAFGNHLHVVKLFSEYLNESQNLEDEKKIDLEQEWKKSFLMCAGKGHLEILKFLHESLLVEVDDNSTHPDRLTALHNTCQFGHYDVAKYLIDNGANVNGKNIIGITPLHFACANGWFDIVRLLIEHEAEVDCPHDHGNTGLFTAAVDGRLEIVEFLYQKGARIHVIDEDGDAPLHDAAKEGHLAVVEFLVAHDAVLDCQNKNGKTALDLALEMGHDEIADFLRRKPINL